MINLQRGRVHNIGDVTLWSAGPVAFGPVVRQGECNGPNFSLLERKNAEKEEGVEPYSPLLGHACNDLT